MREGILIVLEGVDGAGTTTQTELLCNALRPSVPVQSTREPSSGPIGALLRQALSGRWVTPTPFGLRAPGAVTLALLFAADRQDHLEAEVSPLLGEGVSVISDRYYHSSVAYQSLTGAGSIEWIRELNKNARRPDLTIVLDVPADVAERRRRARGGRELFDEAQFQQQLGEFYAQLERHFPGEEIVHVSGDRPPETVAADVLAHARAALAKR
ncbi:MAG TPA: dTMP kinase [Polyangiales bacterium]|nr:dTMP kinase [Polyangiales bacterium]